MHSRTVDVYFFWGTSLLPPDVDVDALLAN